MSKFLNGLSNSVNPNQKVGSSISRAVSGGNNNSQYNMAGGTHGAWDIEQAINQGYERVIWVFRCVDAIASNASGIPIIVRDGDDIDGKIISDPRIHKLFNRRPNSYETAQQFRYRYASQLLLSRTGAFIEVRKDRMGRPAELNILPPSSVTPIKDVNTYVKGYAVRSANGGISILAPDDVIWIRTRPHPTDPYAQMTPMVAAGIAADTDWLARIYNRNFLANDGRPGMLINIRGQLAPEDADEIKRRFTGGVQTAGQTTVIESDGIDAQDMSTSPRDAMYLEAIAGSKSDILLSFGVPESVLGNASGRTFDNADAEFEVFWTVTMLPFLDAIGAGFDGLTIGGLEDNLMIAHDYSKVDVLQRRKRERHDKGMAEVDAGLRTIDSYLTLIGEEPLNVPGTQVLWLPAGKIPIGVDDATTNKAQALQQVGMGAPIPGGGSSGVVSKITEQQRAIAELQSSRALALAGKSVVLPLVQSPQSRGKISIAPRHLLK